MTTTTIPPLTLIRVCASGAPDRLLYRPNPYADRWALRLGITPPAEGEHTWQWSEAAVEGRPTAEELRALVQRYYNEQADARILSGYRWEGREVWLSLENQLTYLAAAQLAHTAQTAESTASEPAEASETAEAEGSEAASQPLTLKLGSDSEPEYVTLATAGELDAFTRGWRGWITACIDEARRGRQETMKRLEAELAAMEEAGGTKATAES